MFHTMKAKLLVVVGVLLLLASCDSYIQIESGTVGVSKTLGTIHNKEMQPGLHAKIPFIQRVAEVNTQMKAYTLKTVAQSFDLQNITTEVTVQHAIDPKLAAESRRVVGDLDKIDLTITSKAITESVKAVDSQYTAEQLVQLRDEVKGKIVKQIRDFIGHTLKEKGIEGAVLIYNVAITDFDFSEAFNKSIEGKVLAAQKAKTAEHKKDERSTEAEAGLIEQQLEGEAAAYETKVVSVAKAGAIGLEGRALKSNPEVKKLRAIEAWHKGGGRLPEFMGSTNNYPPFTNSGN